MNDLKCTIADLEKEKDFYFRKLRNIELICQETEEESELLQRIIDTLYASEVSVAFCLRCMSWSSDSIGFR